MTFRPRPVIISNGPVTNQDTERQKYLDGGYPPQPPPPPPALASSVSAHGSSVPMRMGASLIYAMNRVFVPRAVSLYGNAERLSCAHKDYPCIPSVFVRNL